MSVDKGLGYCIRVEIINVHARIEGRVFINDSLRPRVQNSAIEWFSGAAPREFVQAAPVADREVNDNFLLA